MDLARVQNIGKEIRIGCLTIEIWQTFESFCWGELKTMPPWDLSCIANRPVLERISDNVDFPFWNAHREWFCWNFLSIYHWAVPSILFFYKGEFAQKLPMCGYYIWIAAFSTISKTSCSTNENCSFDSFVKFGIFSWNGRLRGESHIDFRTQSVIMTQTRRFPVPPICTTPRVSTKSIVF